MFCNFRYLVVLGIAFLAHLSSYTVRSDEEKGWSYGVDQNLHDFFVNYGVILDTIKILEKAGFNDEKMMLETHVGNIKQQDILRNFSVRFISNVINPFYGQLVNQELATYDYGNFEINNLESDCVAFKINEALNIINNLKQIAEIENEIKAYETYRKSVMELIKTEYDYINQCHKIVDINVFQEALIEHRKTNTDISDEDSLKYVGAVNQYKNISHVMPVSLQEMIYFASDPLYGIELVKRAYSTTMVNNITSKTMAEILRRYAGLSTLVSDILNRHTNSQDNFTLGDDLAQDLAKMSQYALAPLQRQPRYGMLATEIARNFARLPLDNDEKKRALVEEIEECTKIAPVVARSVNEMQRSIEDVAKKIEDAQKLLAPVQSEMDLCATLFDASLLPRAAPTMVSLVQNPIIFWEEGGTPQVTEYYQHQPYNSDNSDTVVNEPLLQRCDILEQRVNQVEDFSDKILQANRAAAIEFDNENLTQFGGLISKLEAKAKTVTDKKNIDALAALTQLILIERESIRGGDETRLDRVYASLYKKLGGVGIGTNLNKFLEEEASFSLSNLGNMLSFNKRKKISEEDRIIILFRDAYKQKGIFFKAINALKQKESKNHGIKSFMTQS